MSAAGPIAPITGSPRVASQPTSPDDSTCFDQDVFVNAVGGLTISEPAADLAVLAAIVSSLCSKPLPEKMVMLGEAGHAGEICPVHRGQKRLKEAAKLCFTQATLPAGNQSKQKIPGMAVLPVHRLDEAIQRFREG